MKNLKNIVLTFQFKMYPHLTLELQERINFLKRSYSIRRDVSSFSKNFYTQILDSLLANKTFPQILEMIVTTVQNMMDGKIDSSEFVFIKTFSPPYKSPYNPMKMLGDRVPELAAGTQYPVIVLEHSDSKLLGDKLHLYSNYNNQAIDYFYYLNAYRSLDEIIKLAFASYTSQISQISYRISRFHRPIKLITPLNFISTFLQTETDLYLSKLKLNEIINLF